MKTTKKKGAALVLALLISVSSLLAVFTSVASAAQAKDAYPNTHVNTGSQADDLIAVARTQLGYTEVGGYTKYGDYCSQPYGSWCAMFITWCARQAGIGTESGIPEPATLATADGVNGAGYGKFHMAYYDARTYTPKKGDLILYNWSGRQSYFDGDGDHVGIVTDVKNGYVYTIEGNTNDGSAPDRVMEKVRPLSSVYIAGYATPVYKTASVSAPETPAEPETPSAPETPVTPSTPETGTQTPSAPSETENSKEPQYIGGDLSGDGKVNLLDMFVLQLHLHQVVVLDGGYLERADVNGDGSVDFSDMTALYLIVSGQ